MFAVRSDPTSTPSDRVDIDEEDAMRFLNGETLSYLLERHSAVHFTLHRQLTSRDMNAVCRVTCSDMVTMFHVSNERRKQRCGTRTSMAGEIQVLRF